MPQTEAQEPRRSRTTDGEKPKMRFRLLVGIHYGRDYDADPTPVLDAEGKVWTNPKTGKPELRYPPKKYETGSIVEDTVDLVKFGGPEKFAYVDGPPSALPGRGEAGWTPENTAYQVAPGGQVLEGHQQSTSLEDGRTVSGRLDPEKQEEEDKYFRDMQEEKQQKTQEKSQEREQMREKAQGPRAKGKSHSAHTPTKGSAPNPTSGRGTTRSQSSSGGKDKDE